MTLHGLATLAFPGGAPIRIERKHAALLAYVHRAGSTPRGRLAALLWPDATASGARSNLRQCLARLRRSAPGALVEDAHAVALAPAVTVAETDPGTPELLEAYDYADLEEFSRWLQARNDDERGARQAALIADFRAANRRGDFAEAQARADSLLALDRESEDPYRALMEVAYLRGDFAAAVRVWDRCRVMLRQLYGVTPSATTQALGAAVLAASPSAPVTVPAAPRALPLTVLRPPRLIGRDPQLQAVRHAWRAGQIALVCGEAGIGKSRLLAELVAAFGTAVTAPARPGDAVKPYASLTRLVALALDRFRPPLVSDNARWAMRLLPGIAYLAPGGLTAPPQTEHELQRALAGLRALLAECSRIGCAGFVLDDLQFADRATLEALPSLLLPPPVGDEDGRDDNDMVLRFAVASRLEDAAAPSSVLIDALGASRDVVRVDLGPLAFKDAGALVESLALPGRRDADLDARLFAQVGGNPAFLLESLKLLLSQGEGYAGEAGLPIPPGIEAVIQRRVGLLGASARHIAQLAAVAGASYSTEMAAAALARTVVALSEPLRELEQRQVLVGRQFAHDLVATAVAQSIPASVAEFMHRFVAGHLESSGADPAVVAGHWRAAGERQRAGAAYLVAAEAARETTRPRECAELLDTAIACLEGTGADDLLFDAIERRLDLVEAADATLVRGSLNQRLQALARSEEQQLRVLLHQSAFLSDHNQMSALPTLESGLARARALQHSALAFRFAEPIAHLLSAHGRLDEALGTLESFAPWIATQSDVRLQARLQRTLAIAHFYSDKLVEGIVHGERAIGLYRSVADDLGSLPAMSNVGLALHWRGRLADALAMLDAAVALRDRLHGDKTGHLLDVNRAAVLRDLGEFVPAETSLLGVVAHFRGMVAASTDEPATDLVSTENHLAQLWLMLGQPEAALTCMQADDSRVDARFRSRRLALRLRGARNRREPTQHLDAEADAIAAQIGSPFHRAMFELETLRSRPAAEALAGFAALYDEAPLVERPGLRLHAAVRAAEAALGAGDLAAAVRWAALALPDLERVPPMDIDTDTAWYIVAGVAKAMGENVAASRAMTRAGQHVAGVAARLPKAWIAAYLASRAGTGNG